jgi:hypothetical protein
MSTQGMTKSNTIEAGAKHEVKIPVDKVGTAVKWFYGMNMEDPAVDIGFEAYFVGTDFGNFNQKTPITPYTRLKIPKWPAGLSGSTQVSTTRRYTDDPQLLTHSRLCCR